MTSHNDCTHPSTKKDRSACRKARAAGTTHTATADSSAPSTTTRRTRPKPAPGSVDARIRSAKRLPKKVNPVTTYQVDPATLGPIIPGNRFTR